MGSLTCILVLFAGWLFKNQLLEVIYAYVHIF